MLVDQLVDDEVGVHPVEHPAQLGAREADPEDRRGRIVERAQQLAGEPALVRPADPRCAAERQDLWGDDGERLFRGRLRRTRAPQGPQQPGKVLEAWVGDPEALDETNVVSALGEAPHAILRLRVAVTDREVRVEEDLPPPQVVEGTLIGIRRRHSCLRVAHGIL